MWITIRTCHLHAHLRGEGGPCGRRAAPRAAPRRVVGETSKDVPAHVCELDAFLGRQEANEAWLHALLARGKQVRCHDAGTAGSKRGLAACSSCQGKTGMLS
eukprot:365402-Chlamydomonas_euryale.AAC.6